MGRFRTLAADEVASILASFGAPAYRGHEAIAAGTINTNFRVETADGPRFLRVNEGKALEDVKREAAIVKHVAALGVPTPPPVETPTGEPFVVEAGSRTIVSLFPWTAGRTLKRREVAPAHARDVGRVLAGLHGAGEEFTDRRPGRYEVDEIGRRFSLLAAAASTDGTLVEPLATLGSELQALLADRSPALPEGIIHGDLFIDNVLWSPDGRLTALLDFEQASWGRFAYDLAVTTLAWAFGAADFRPEVAAALFAGYAEVRPPTDAERGGFLAELRFAACRFAVTRITDVHMRRHLGAPEGKDFRRYLLRLRRVIEHAADGTLALP